MPYPFIEGCFKGLYLTFVRYSKFSNATVAAGQAFMAQCVVEVLNPKHSTQNPEPETRNPTADTLNPQP